MRDYHSHDEHTARVLARHDAHADLYDDYEPDGPGPSSPPARFDLLTTVRSAVTLANRGRGYEGIEPSADGQVTVRIGEGDDPDRIASFLTWFGVTSNVDDGVLYATEASAA